LNAWRDRAACLGYDPQLWFAESTNPAKDRVDKAAALRICKGCPVAEACLEDAVEVEAGLGVLRRWGIRGGLPPSARHRTSTPARRNSLGPALCGSDRGYMQHLRLGETTCQACRAYRHTEALKNKAAARARAVAVA
jgi:hypothetical protein